MPAPIVYRALLPADWSAYRAARLAALQDSPDAFGSTLALEMARPPELWKDRLVAAQTSGADFPLAAWDEEERVVGLVWAKGYAASPALVNLFQMWVAPQQRGQGVGRALLAQALAWARSIGAEAVQLGVTCADTPAVRLYEGCGFQTFGEPVPLREGSSLLAQNMSLRLTASAPPSASPA